jgi:putative SOS response-associated peptidase YedK
MRRSAALVRMRLFRHARSMCGRVVITSAPAAIRAIFGTTNATPNYQPSWNVAPTQQAMVIRRHPDTGERSLDLLRWGLAPHFTKGQRDYDLQQAAARLRRQIAA